MGKMQKKKIGRLIFLILGLSIIVGVRLIEFFKPPREKYHAIDFENDSSWGAIFFTDYKKAIAQNDGWVKDAETIALRVAGYPNDDNIPPEKVDVEIDKDGKMIVTVLSRRLMDDSVLRQETRVELIKNGDIWKIIWAGWRQQCARGSLGFGWTKSFCP